jgi:primosomal protein N' (replication factor Y)
MSVLRLAIPSPLRRNFDYLPPAGMSQARIDTLQPGVRLRVPFGAREVTGYLLGVFTESAISEDALKPALELLDDAPLLDAQMLQLCHWAADYYHHPLGDVYTTLFPKRLREGKPVQLPGVPGWQLTTRGKGLPEAALPRSPRQAQALSLLRQRGFIASSELKSCGISAAILRNLQEKRLIESCAVNVLLAPATTRQGLILNDEQTAVLQALVATEAGYSCHLLEGVTGSGKTEIYLQLIAACLQRGRQALVLVPEIGPHTADAVALPAAL